MLVLKQNAANTVPTPPAGKGTIFLTDNDDIAVKTNDGNVTTFPTVGGANTQVFFNDEGAIGGSANMVFNKTTNVLTVTGNVAATNVLTDNLKYANGANWDLQQPGGSNTQLQFNDADQFGGSANLTFNKTNNTLALLGTANISEINTTGNVLVGGNLTVNGNVTYINVDTLNVEDPIISLGGGPNGDPLASDDGKDRGTALQYYSGAARTAFMGWDNSNAEFGMGAVTSIVNDVVTFSTYGNLRVSYIIGNGSALSGITGGNVSGQVANALVAGTVYTNAQPNITSVGTLTSLLVGASASTADFPNAKVIVAQDNSGQTHSENIGLVGEAVADSGNTSTWGIGVLGEARANGATKATGVQGGAYVTNSADTGAAVGVRGYATMTHAGGYNIGVLGNAAGSGLGNYAFYVQAGNIASIETDTTWDLNDNSATALAFSSSGKANILRIDTTDSAEGVAMAGTLSVTGNSNVSNLGASGLITATGNVSGGNLTTAGAVAATGNVSGGNLTTAGAVAATGNVSGGNLTTAGVVSATGNISGGNINTAGKVVASTLESNVATGTAPLVVASTTKVANLNADLLDGFSTATAATANTVVIRDADGSFSANIITGTLSGAATTAGTVTTAAQPNITSVGTLTSLAVTGNGTFGNVYANSGIIGAQNLKGEGGNISNIQGANVSGTVSSATTAGTVTTAAQPNITSVGTLSSLSVTGNVAAGNLTTVGILSVTGTGTSSIAGNLDMTSNNITNLAEPVNPSDAATKQYVDDVAQGLHTHDSCNAATPDTLANITGGTITYNNGSSGVGANLVTTGSFNLIDGVNVQTAGTRILVKNEANSAHNGIYVWSNATVITRATDFDTPAEMAGGDFTFVNGGTIYDNTGWVMTDPVTTVGTSPVPWVQFSGAGTYTAGTGLTLTGTVFSVNASQTQITSVGTLTSLGVSGTITAANITANTGVFTGNGSGLSALNASNISSGTLDQARLANSSLTVNGQSISLGGSATITANTTQTLTLGSYLTGTSFNGGTAVTANVDATSANTASKVVARDSSGNFSAGTITATLSGAATTAGTVTTAAQPNITSVGTLTSLAVTGNITAGNVSVSAGTVTLGTLTTGANSTAGTVTGNWTLSAGSRWNATYADLAEKYVADADYEPGTVLVFGGEKEVSVTGMENSTRVAGIVSTDPAYVMNAGCEGEHVVTLALMGRVPCKVEGNVRKGDLLVTSSVAGYAKVDNEAKAGTIIGKALQNFDGHHGVVEVVVGRV